MSNIELPVSIGEALDKLTILDIKVEKIKNEQKRADCQKERDVLYAKLKQYVDQYSFWYKTLKEVNHEIWCQQDILRATNNTEDLAKRVLDLNDLRFRIKNKINTYSVSFLKEQKGYEAKVLILKEPMSLEQAFYHRDILYYLSIEYDSVYLSIMDGTLKELFTENLYIVEPETLSTLQGKRYEKPLSREIVEDLHLSKQILEKLTPTSALFVGHLGLGDMLGLNGAVNYIAKEYDEIFIVTYSKNYSNIRTLYNERHKVKLLTIEDESMMWVRGEWTLPFVGILKHFSKVYLSGIYLPNHEICVDIPNCFYRDLQLSPEIKTTHFCLPNLQESKYLLDIIGNREFIFVQQQASDALLPLIQWDKHKILTIDPNVNVYKPADEFYTIAEQCRNLPFFYYFDLIKKAKEIHVVNSSFSSVLLLRPWLKAKVKRIYDRYTGKEAEETKILHVEEKKQIQREIQAVLDKYDIQPTENNSVRGKAMGLGDLMTNIRCVKLGLLQPPIYINVNLFEESYDNPANALEFRIQILKDLLQYNGLSSSIVQYIRSTNLDTDQEYKWKDITFKPLQFSLPPLPSFLLDKKYIVIHTKCRHTRHVNYDVLKQLVHDFSSNSRFFVPIVILGERTFPNNYEHRIHGITTVYSELEPLKSQNTVFDLTREEIIDTLDYEQYQNDLAIMRGASLNIHFGLGGSLVSCMNFCHKTLALVLPTDGIPFDKEKCKQDFIYLCEDFVEFIKTLVEVCKTL